MSPLSRRALATGLCLASLSSLAGCSRKVTRAECAEMLDHYIDMSIAEDPSLKGLPAAQEASVREMKRAIKKGVKSYARVQDQCEKEISRKEYTCAMKAPSPNEWEACID